LLSLLVLAAERLVAAEQRAAAPLPDEDQAQVLPRDAEAGGVAADAGYPGGASAALCFRLRFRFHRLILRVVQGTVAINSAKIVPVMDTRQQQNVPVSQIFSERLVLLRKNRSKRAFCKEIGIDSPQTYQHYENGRIPCADTLAQIADRCGVSVDWLLGRAELNLTRETKMPTDRNLTREITVAGTDLTCENSRPSEHNSAEAAVRETRAAYGVAERLAEVEARLATIERLLLRVLAENE
jgi:transcriptional regulator with XRE-family HTH domain